MNIASSSRIVGRAAVATLVVGVALAVPAAALATQPAPEHKVTICHRTNSDANPYVVITVDIASSGHLKGGHDTQHEGPVWDPSLKAQHLEWGDIIPPYAYGDFSYAGQNWTAEGEAAWDNGCVAPDPAETPTEDTPEGGVEGVVGLPELTPPPTDTAQVSSERSGDPSMLLLVLAAAAVAIGLSADRARVRARR